MLGNPKKSVGIENEVSLVNALKNSYEGIEEIKISIQNIQPLWRLVCDVDILFSDKVK